MIRDRRVHEPPADPRHARGQALRHLGVRVRALRDVDRPAGIHGGTAADAIAMILQREPDWTALSDTTPPIVVRLIRRCLEKDPKRRLHDVADARIEIDDVIAGAAVAPSGVESAASARPWRWLGTGVLIGCASLLAWSVARRTPVTSAPSSVSFERLTDFVGMEESPAISPDGKAVAFVARAGTNKQIWVRLLTAARHCKSRVTPSTMSTHAGRLIRARCCSTRRLRRRASRARFGKCPCLVARRDASARHRAAATSATTAGGSRRSRSAPQAAKWNWPSSTAID